MIHPGQSEFWRCHFFVFKSDFRDGQWWGKWLFSASVVISFGLSQRWSLVFLLCPFGSLMSAGDFSEFISWLSVPVKGSSGKEDNPQARLWGLPHRPARTFITLNSVSQTLPLDFRRRKKILQKQAESKDFVKKQTSRQANKKPQKSFANSLRMFTFMANCSAEQYGWFPRAMQLSVWQGGRRRISWGLFQTCSKGTAWG